MVGHTVPEFSSFSKDVNSPSEVREELERRGGPIVLNYRFIRDFTKGVEPKWTINALNHFHMEEAD